MLWTRSAKGQLDTRKINQEIQGLQGSDEQGIEDEEPLKSVKQSEKIVARKNHASIIILQGSQEKKRYQNPGPRSVNTSYKKEGYETPGPGQQATSAIKTEVGPSSISRGLFEPQFEWGSQERSE